MAVAFGVATPVLIPFAWNGYSGRRVRGDMTALADEMARFESSIGVPMRDFYIPYGSSSPAQWYTLMARRHPHEYDDPREALGAIAVACRAHAQLNDRAVMRGRPMTMDDYLAPGRRGSASRTSCSTAASRPTARRRSSSRRPTARAASGRSPSSSRAWPKAIRIRPTTS